MKQTTFQTTSQGEVCLMERPFKRPFEANDLSNDWSHTHNNNDDDGDYKTRGAPPPSGPPV